MDSTEAIRLVTTPNKILVQGKREGMGTNAV